MADEKNTSGSQSKYLTGPKSPIFAGTSHIPTIFADYIAPITVAAGNVRFCLLRVDPEIFGNEAEPRLSPVIQVVMSTAGLAHMVCYLETQVKRIEASDETFAGMLKELRGELGADGDPVEDDPTSVPKASEAEGKDA